MIVIGEAKIEASVPLPTGDRLCVLGEGCDLIAEHQIPRVMGLLQNAIVIDDKYNLKWFVAVKPKRNISSWISDAVELNGVYYLIDFNENKYKLSGDFRVAQFSGSANSLI